MRFVKKKGLSTSVSHNEPAMPPRLEVNQKMAMAEAFEFSVVGRVRHDNGTLCSPEHWGAEAEVCTRQKEHHAVCGLDELRGRAHLLHTVADFF
jgi:hypothetical protein